jgi:hypothetical protein
MPVKSGENDELKQYIHDEQKRLNNPPDWISNRQACHRNGKKTYQFDPDLACAKTMVNCIKYNHLK